MSLRDNGVSKNGSSEFDLVVVWVMLCIVLPAGNRCVTMVVFVVLALLVPGLRSAAGLKPSRALGLLCCAWQQTSEKLVWLSPCCQYTSAASFLDSSMSFLRLSCVAIIDLPKSQP